MFSCHKGHIDVVKVLLEHDANIEVGDDEDQTPLMFSCQRGHMYVLKVVLEHNANIEAVDDKVRLH